MGNLYYGRQAYEGFARAFAAKMGVTVTVSSNCASPQVDASGTITLPSMDKFQAEVEFEDTCATIIHEISHVFYGSHRFFQTAIAGKSALYKDCLNAVMDVADETAISKYEISRGNNRAEQLLVLSCGKSLRNDGLKPGNTSAPAHWRILSTTLIKARLTGQKTVRVSGLNSIDRHLVKEYPQVDIGKVQTLLHRVRLQFGRNGLDGRSSYQRWDCEVYARKLEELLQPLAPPPGAPSNPMPGGTGAGESGTGIPGAMSKGKDSMPSGSVEATAEQGAAQAGAGQSPAVNQPAQGQPGTGAGGGYATGGYGPFSQDAYDMVLPVIRRVAQRIAVDGDSIASEDGYLSGSGVSDPVRAATDGACFGRWITDPHADGLAVAVLLDASGSMAPFMASVCAVADAFATGMEECASVGRWAFSYSSARRSAFKGQAADGGTNTHLAIQDAKDWLATQEAGAKVIVCITDGSPNDIDETRRLTRELTEAGVTVVGVSIGDEGTARDIAESMPGAQVIQARDATRLAIKLESLSLTM